MSASPSEPAGAPAALPDLAGRRAALAERVRRARAGIEPEAATTIPRRPEGAPAVLSFAQERLWFMDQLAQGTPSYNIPLAIPLPFAVDVARLQAALDGLVARHSTLRTVFSAGPDGPRQSVQAPAPVALPVTDLQAIPAARREAEAMRQATEEALLPFDLRRGPLLRARLLRLAPAEHRLLLTLHHIVADGWSMGVLFREFTELYNAQAEGRPPVLPALPVDYADFATWQRGHLSGARLEGLLQHWRRRLAGLPELRLIADRPRPRVASFAGAFHTLSVPAETAAAARGLANAFGATLFQLLLAAFKALLARWTGQADIVVGAPIANRLRPELEGLIGFFVNTLVLRTDLAGDPGFADILARVRDTTLDAYANQELPFERLVEALRPGRDMARNPLCQVTFQLQNAGQGRPPAVDGVAGSARGLDALRVERPTAILDMAVSLWETRAGLVGGIEYSTDLFDAETVAALAEAYLTLLAAALRDPALPLSRLPLLDAPARARRLAALQGRAGAGRPAPLVVAGFRTRAAVAPQATALQDAAGPIAYAALAREVERVAAGLARSGIGRGATVALLLPRGREVVVAMLGVLQAGAAYLPLDPDLPQQRLETMLAAARPALVLATEGPTTVAEVARRGDGAAVPWRDPAPDDPAYVLFTSGSTGLPKGVVVPHRALANHMAWMQRALPLAAADRVLQRTPLHFDASVWEIFAPLLAGATLHIPQPFAAADTEALARALVESGATVAQFVPSLLGALLEERGLAGAAALRRVCCGGEPLTAALVQQLRARLGAVEVANLYGPTETTIEALWWMAEGDLADPVPIGRPIDNARAYVLGPHDTLQPANALGEICIGGLPVALGYLGGSADAAARFASDPFAADPAGPGARMFRTGDLGWARHDGVFFCAGRLDHQVKIRGNRVELGEIEAALACHPAVVEAAAVPFRDARGDAAIAAYVTLAEGEVAGGAAGGGPVQAHLAEWGEVYEGVYAGAGAADGEPMLDTTGWVSSHTGEPIPREEMRRWLDHTVARIRDLRPRRVLELGCGTGMILFRVAPEAERYLACDFSPTAVAALRRAVARSGLALPGLEIARREAAELDGLEAEGFDTAVLNSVVQYLPGLDHLEAVLRRLGQLLARDGAVFVGDVRHLGLLPAFHLSVARARAAPGATVGAVRDQARRLAEQEKELVIDPRFFLGLAGDAQAFGSAAVLAKCGHDANELVRYRCDVVLHRAPPPAAPPLAWRDWRRQGLDLDGLRPLLAVGPDAVLALRGVPDGRVARDLHALSRFAEADPAQAAADLAAALDATAPAAAEAPEPEALLALAEAAGWQAAPFLAADRPGELDIVLWRPGSGLDLAAAALTAAGAADAPLLHRRRLATNPLVASVGARLVPELRAHLRALLPEAAIPARIEPIAELPLTPNGKLDRAALAPAEAPAGAANGAGAAPPKGALERLVAETWAEVLRTGRVGREEHFFNTLGGHSLIATQAVARLREALQAEIPLRLLFLHPTVAAFAEALAREGTTPREELEHVAAFALDVAAMDEAALDAALDTD